jgi:hypothetical protein
VPTALAASTESSTGSEITESQTKPTKADKIAEKIQTLEWIEIVTERTAVYGRYWTINGPDDWFLGVYQSRSGNPLSVELKLIPKRTFTEFKCETCKFDNHAVVVDDRSFDLHFCAPHLPADLENIVLSYIS